MKSFEHYAPGGTGARGREEEPRVAFEYEGYKKGDPVAVIRTGGDLEKDWTFQYQRMDTGEILVTKNVPGGTLSKEISPESFDKAQKAAAEEEPS